MLTSREVNLNDGVIETLYQHEKDAPTSIVDLVVVNLRKDSPIFFDVWKESTRGSRFYLEYNSQLNNYDNIAGTYNHPYKNPIKIIRLEKGERLRAKSYVDILNSTSSTPSDWSSVTLEDWSDGQPWDALPDQNLSWWEGTLQDWMGGFDHWWEYTFNAPQTSVLNASVFLTLHEDN